MTSVHESLNRRVRELEESARRYELAVAGLEAGLWDWDIRANELFTSDRLKELLGFAPDELSLTVDEFWNRVHPDDYPAVRRAAGRLLAERVPFNEDYRLQAKSGEYRWFHDHGQAVWDETGTAIRMSGSLTDINERKGAEQALRDSRRRLMKAQHLARMGFLDWNLNTNDIVLSEEVYDLYGIDSGTPVTVEQTVGLVHPDDLEFVNENLNMALEGVRDYDIDHRIVRPDGKVIWVHARADLERDEEGRPATLMGTVVDITERKLAEEKLSQSEERFRNLMEQSPLAIEILSPEGQIAQVNAAWLQLWGLRDEEDKDQVLAAYNMLTDEQIKERGLMPLVERAFAGEQVVLPAFEYSAPRAGEEMGLEGLGRMVPWIQCHLYPVKDQNGDVMYIVNTYMDITDMKHAEQEAREQRDALARVERATSMGQLTGSIAHELNQPLTGILSSAQAGEILIKKGQLDSDELTEIMAAITADAKRAGEVIHHLRDLYREQKGEFAPVDITQVVEEVMRLLHSELVLERVELTTECAPSTPLVDGNRVQLEQVLVNLIMNGIQAMSGVTGDSRRLYLGTESDVDEVAVWVEDRGSGIDPDTLDHIFEPLATWKPGGTGMGLAVSNSIVEAHGGRMWAQNLPDVGARVGFALPVKKAGPPA